MPTAIFPKTSPTPRLKRSTLLARQICLSIAQGNSLISTCKTLKISKPFVLDWLRSDPDFASHYSRAREDQADKYADEVVEISDRATVQDAHAGYRKHASNCSKAMPTPRSDQSCPAPVPSFSFLLCTLPREGEYTRYPTRKRGRGFLREKYTRA